MLRLAIVGAGWAGARQAEAVRELGRKVIVACLVDNDPDHLAATATRLGIAQTYTEVAAALADPAVDAVSICLPHALHAPIAHAAAAAGKHILCEKPLATTVDEATAMIAAAERADVRLYVAENEVYEPLPQFLRPIARPVRWIGALTGAAFVGGFRAAQFGYPGRRAWLTEPSQGGTGTWMLHGVHSMARLRYVLGEVRTVYLREHHAPGFGRPDLEGTMSGLLTLENGLAVTVIQTCETPLAPLAGFTLYGEQGCLRATAERCELFLAGEPPQIVSVPPSPLSSYARELEAFADYVAGGASEEDDTETPTTGRSERRTLAVVQAGYESVQSGQPVDLRARFGPL